MMLFFLSCQKQEGDELFQEYLEITGLVSTSQLSVTNFNGEISNILYGHKIFTRLKGEPFTETIKIENPHFNCFDGNFILKIQNGNDKNTRVSSAEILINGILVVGSSDFSKNESMITKTIYGLTRETKLEVRLNSTPGSFIDLWIEGTLNLVTPTFQQIDPLLLNSVAPELPNISNNGITGTWYPEVINTDNVGTFSFTFTPDPNQCSVNSTMNIEVLSKISDIDGNIYNVIKIGDEWWMMENLKTTKYRNGDLIEKTSPLTLDITAENAPKYQWPAGGDESKAFKYGRLYTHYAVTDTRNICPNGWHLPSDAEWSALTSYLIVNGYGYGGSGTAIAKSMASSSGWKTSTIIGSVGNDQANNNTSGFEAVPSGYRNRNGVFLQPGSYSGWWSSNASTLEKAWYRGFSYTRVAVTRGSDYMQNAYSVRCIKDK